MSASESDSRRYPPSQDDVLETFRRWLNTERHANYQIDDRPDKTYRNRPDIDYILDDPQTTPRIAVEVSSVWRSKKAGKEDDDFDKWFERVRARVRGRVAGTFYVSLPVRVPRRLDSEGFGDDLVNRIQREAATSTTFGTAPTSMSFPAS